MYFLREQCWRTPMFWNVFFEGATSKNTYVLKTIHVLKSINNLFKIYGCWLVWLLLYIFMAAKYIGCWSIFFIKVFTTRKTFAILTCINTKLRCIEDCGLLWIKQTDGPGLCFEDQYEALQLSRKKLPAPNKTLIKAGCAKMLGMSVR